MIITRQHGKGDPKDDPNNCHRCGARLKFENNQIICPTHGVIGVYDSAEAMRAVRAGRKTRSQEAPKPDTF